MRLKCNKHPHIYFVRFMLSGDVAMKTIFIYGAKVVKFCVQIYGAKVVKFCMQMLFVMLIS